MTETLSGFKLARRVVFSLLQICQYEGLRASQYATWMVPCMRHADHMIYIAQAELQQLVRHNARSIAEAKERVIGKDRPQTHGPSMQDAFMA